MLWIVQLLIGISIVGGLILLFLSKKEFSIWRIIVSLLVYATGLYMLYDRLVLKQILWSEDVSKSWAIFLIISISFTVIAIFHYFSKFFTTRPDVKPQILGLLIGAIGIFAILANQYPILFWLLITFGVLVAVSRFVIPKKYALKALWLTILYLLPLTLAVSFILIKTGTVELINSSQFVNFSLFTVEYEFLLMMIIPSYILLVLYNLPWEKVGSWFSRIRIV